MYKMSDLTLVKEFKIKVSDSYDPETAITSFVSRHPHEARENTLANDKVFSGETRLIPGKEYAVKLYEVHTEDSPNPLHLGDLLKKNGSICVGVRALMYLYENYKAEMGEKSVYAVGSYSYYQFYIECSNGTLWPDWHTYLAYIKRKEGDMKLGFRSADKDYDQSLIIYIKGAYIVGIYELN
jgi:hypothetical protein